MKKIRQRCHHTAASAVGALANARGVTGAQPGRLPAAARSQLGARQVSHRLPGARRAGAQTEGIVAAVRIKLPRQTTRGKDHRGGFEGAAVNAQVIHVGLGPGTLGAAADAEGR